MRPVYNATPLPPRLFMSRRRRQRPQAASDALRGRLPALDDLFDELAKGSAELGAVNRELVGLEHQQRTVAAQDAAAFAEARRAGRKDPGAVNAELLATQTQNATRRQAGLRTLVARVAADIDRLIDTHGHELIAAMLAERAAHLAEQHEHEAAAGAAAAAVQRVGLTLQWLQSGGADDDGPPADAEEAA